MANGDLLSTVKQGDNALGSVRLSVCAFADNPVDVVVWLLISINQ